MKTTNFEISKKLKEAGFEADADYYWVEGIICVNAYVFSDYMTGGKKLCNSYDLETLLDALPKINKQEYLLCSGGIAYLNDDYISIGREKNESLADTAGKMWLLLKEKGLV